MCNIKKNKKYSFKGVYNQSNNEENKILNQLMSQNEFYSCVETCSKN
jgi:hypothetical protein